MLNWLRKVALFLAGELLRSWIWPIAVTAAGVMIGFAQHIQLFNLYVGAVILFSVSSMGLLRFSEWRYRNRVADMLNFHSVRTDRIIDKAGVVKSLRIGATFNNKALFPVTFEVVNVVSTFDKLYPTKEPYAKNSYTIPAGGMGWFDDHYIPIEQKRSGVFEGGLEFEFKYGRKGKTNNTLHINKKLFLHFNEKGDIQRVDFIDQ